MKSAESKAGVALGLTGVGGWLTLLVVGLMALGPLRSVERMTAELSKAEAANAALTTNALWMSYKANAWMLWGIFSTVSFGAGYCLYKIHLRRSVHIAIAALWVIGPGFAIADMLNSYLTVLRPMHLPLNTDDLLAATIASAVASAFWTGYLLRSKRVKNTYKVPMAR